MAPHLIHESFERGERRLYTSRTAALECNMGKNDRQSKEHVYKNDLQDKYVYQHGQFESADHDNGYGYGRNRQIPGTEKTLNREARREYKALEDALDHNKAGKKNDEQRHRLNSERELKKYPNELSQLTDRMASDTWQG